MRIPGHPVARSDDIRSSIPEARVVFSTRSAEAWWHSYARTVGKLRQLYPTLPVQTNVAETLDTMKRLMIHRGIDPEMRNRDAAIAAFHRQLAEVRARVPAERLLDGFTAIIDQWPRGDLGQRAKQRQTAKRLFERLRDEHGFSGGYTIVKDYIREHRRRGREMFVPLHHSPECSGTWLSLRGWRHGLA